MLRIEIKKIAEKYDPKSATIIVSEPSTGDVLALANYPDFDLNEFWRADMDTMRNRAISDMYEPGSTFKAVTIAAGLNEGVITPESIFDCSQGIVNHRGRDLKLPKDHHNYGEMNIVDIMKKSSNRGAAFVGVELGERNI